GSRDEARAATRPFSNTVQKGGVFSTFPARYPRAAVVSIARPVWALHPGSHRSAVRRPAPRARHRDTDEAMADRNDPRIEPPREPDTPAPPPPNIEPPRPGEPEITRPGLPPDIEPGRQPD